jgi:ABC-2 type transport system permease protein
MTLLAVERIKLFSTRSPWWCAALAIVLTVGFTGLSIGNTDSDLYIDVASTQFGYQFGLAVVMVLAALTITTEYRFGTIRSTFQAIPHRTPALLAKTAVVALTAGILGLICAFGSWALGTALKPTANLALDSAPDWRTVAGVGLVFALAAIIAIAVGIMIRHTAGAVALLLTYALAAENLILLIPDIGDDIHQWMPFNVANRFLTGNPEPSTRPEYAGPPPSDSTLDPWWALAYFAGVAAVLLTTALVTAKRRDA